MTHKTDEEGPVVWYLDTSKCLDITFGFRGDLHSTDRAAYSRQHTLFNRGELDLDEWPDRLWLDRAYEREQRDLPHILVAGGFLSVSDAVAEVLRECDLGPSRLNPVNLLRADRATPFEGNWNLLQIVTRKDGFELDLSENVPKPIFPKDSKYPYSIRLGARDLIVRVNESVLGGPEIWKDPRANWAVFMSDRMMTALTNAKLIPPLLPILRCPVVRGG